MPVLKAENVAVVLSKGSSAKMESAAASRFKPGDKVRALNIHPVDHTRLPRYVRGRTGEVMVDYGAFIFPDEHARSGKKIAQNLYSVRFTAKELWSTQTKDVVYLDLFDHYLEPAK